jgi:hypothetical protein
MFEHERIKLVYDKFIRIPHLNITDYVRPAPLKDILKEYLQFSDDDFYPYISGLENEDIKTHMAENWKGMCIIDSCTSGRHNIDYLVTENNFHKLEFKFDNGGQPIYSPTDVGKLMPDTMSFLYDIVHYPKKTRLSRMIANGGNATWHSHRLLANTGDRRFTSGDNFVTPVLHIPLITNNKCYMGVSTRFPPRDGDVKKHWQRYHPGEVWLFNSYYYHQAVNLGRTHRDHIMMYVPMDDKTMFPIVEKAVQEYDGELLDNIDLK